RTVTPFEDGDLLLILRVRAKFPERRGSSPALHLLEKCHRAVQIDRQDVILFAQRFVLAGMLDIRSEPSDPGIDDLAIFGMVTDAPGEGQKLNRGLEFDL